MYRSRQIPLVAYFPHTGQNYVGGAILDLPIGNTARIAKQIADETGADLLELKAVREYPFAYEECTATAKAELRANSRPELVEIPDIGGYEAIFLGYPNWWGTMPMPVWTFLEAHDFTGKTIYPFCTHEGSGMGNSERDLKRLCPTARIEKGLAVRGSEAKDAEKAVRAWIESINRRS